MIKALKTTPPRLKQVSRLALLDLRHGWPTTLCLTVAVTAALLPLLILFGLKFGIVSNLIETLRSDPNVREIRLVRDTELQPTWFEDLAARPDVGFLLPRVNFLASAVRLRGPNGGSLLETRLVPTAPGDPLRGDLPLPQSPGEVLLTERAAIELDAGPGDTLELLARRISDDKPQGLSHPLSVIGVLDRDKLQTDDILVDPRLEIALEAWRQGFAVPDLGWTSKDGSMGLVAPDRQSFSSFRLYANDVRDVPSLRDLLLKDRLDVRTRAEDVLRVLVIERALTLVFLALTVLGAVGFFLTLGLHLVASISEKARELAILRLLGMSSLELSLMPSLQGLVIAAIGATFACLLAWIGQPIINDIFGGLGGLEGQVSTLRLRDFLVAISATGLAGALAGCAAGARTASIEPRRGLRHD